MSEEINEGFLGEAIDRREAIKKTAMVAGAAAFATPIVMSTFSSPALALDSACLEGGGGEANCDSTDSDAIRIEEAADERWNVNCESGSTWGRYNSQRSEYTSGDLIVYLQFGELGVDNFDVERSYYYLIAVDSEGNPYQCTAYWTLERGNGRPLCDRWEDGVNGQYCSVPPSFAEVPPGPDVPAGLPRLSLPYCKALDNHGNPACPSDGFLVLKNLVCCPADQV